MSWDHYLNRLLSNEDIYDCAITGTDAVWEAGPTGILKHMTSAELHKLLGDDRRSLIEGFTLASMRCVVIRDNLDTGKTIDIVAKSQEGDKYSISVAKSRTAFVFAMGKPNTQNRSLNDAVFKVAEDLETWGL